MQRTDSPLCWGATYTPPFRRHDAITLVALSDEPPAVSGPLPIWSELHAEVFGPVCSSCHGSVGSAGLSGMGDCNTAYAALVGVASTENPTMSRVAAGDPLLSWMMQKLDNTQGWFTAQCSGMFCGALMPLGGPQLPLETRDSVRQWITDGALNDCP